MYALAVRYGFGLVLVPGPDDDQQPAVRYRAPMENPIAWSDEPINGLEEDSFDRGPFAKLLAETIDRIQVGAASTVFGLVGSWGSGKSSVAAMVGEMLPDTWIVQTFTPWAAAGTTALQLEFVAALDTALEGGLAQKETAKAAIRKYVKWASPVLATLPLIGPVLADTTQTAFDDFAARKPWSVEFEALAEILKSMKKRVLIVCDDIDRLDAVELLEFLKVVRLLGRFPNVHYLVAYDADTVEDLLAAEGVGGRTSSFMEKIVQHPFELPRISVATRWRHISRAITHTLDDQGIRLDEMGMERYRLLIDTLTSGLVTPRQIARYENHIEVLSKLVPGEVDSLDFAALANLRLNHHEIYEMLPEWAASLRSGLKSGINDPAPTERDWISRLEATSRRPNITGAWESIRFLFPNVRVSHRGLLHPQAFADSNYTERYYSLNVSGNDVSDVIVSRAIMSLLGRQPDIDAEAAISTVFIAAQASVARLALEKLRNRRRALLNENDQVGKLVTFLLSQYERVEPSRNDLDSSLDVLFDWLAEEALRGYNKGEFDRDEILQLMGEKLSLMILLRLSAHGGSDSDERTQALLIDFADHFLDAFTNDDKSALEPLESLRLRLSLISRAKGADDLVGLLDRKVDGDVAAFESVAVAMVRTESWVGRGTVRQNLTFEAKEWETAVSPNVRERMAARLTDEFDSEQVDADDVSDSNRRRMAITNVRSEFGFGFVKALDLLDN